MLCHRPRTRSVALGAGLLAVAIAGAQVPALDDIGIPATIDRSTYHDVAGQTQVVFDEFLLPGGESVTLTLSSFDVFTPDAQLRVVTDQGEQALPRPQVALLRGGVAGQAGSRVYLALSPTGVNGLIETKSRTYVVTSGLERDQLPVLVYDMADLPEGLIDPAFLACATDLLDHPPQRPVGDGGGVLRDPVCRRATIAVETDWEYREIWGNEAGATAYAGALFGAVSEIYQRDINCTLQVNYLRIWNTSNDPWTENGGTTSQLYQFRDYWVDNMTHIDRNTTHFLSGRGLGGGVAWLPGLCFDDYKFGLSANLNGYFPYPTEHNNAQNWDLMVVSHEIGHNFGAPHTHSVFPRIDNCAGGDCSVVPNGTIMSYCHLCSGGLANVRMEFHERIINEHILVRLDDPNFPNLCDLVVDPPTITDQPDDTTVCEGADVTLSVMVSEPGLSFQWRKNGANLPGETDMFLALEDVTSADSGDYRCVVSNECYMINSAIATVTVCDDPGPGDIDGDCDTDLADLSVLLANYGTPSGAGPEDGDVDGDGDVDLEDLSVVLAVFGASC